MAATAAPAGAAPPSGDAHLNPVAGNCDCDGYGYCSVAKWRRRRRVEPGRDVLRLRRLQRPGLVGKRLSRLVGESILSVSNSSEQLYTTDTRTHLARLTQTLHYRLGLGSGGVRVTAGVTGVNWHRDTVALGTASGSSDSERRGRSRAVPGLRSRAESQ